MPNPVLTRLLAERATQIAFIDQLLARVESEGRDLVDAERSNLEGARQRIAELDAQIGPLEEFETLRGNHDAGIPPVTPPPSADRVPAEPRRIDGSDQTPVYRSAGAFMVDLLRARGITDRNMPDPAAAARVQQARVVANQITTDTPGILPTPIVGQVVNLIDSNRPLISSLGGAKPMDGIPGAIFTRPKITQHTTVGPQAAEKTQLSSQQMKIDPVTFTKATYGGTVDISRQDIDWTSPAAWDILIRDLADVYAVQTETAVAAAFKLAATGAAQAVAGDTLADWADALYNAAAESYSVGKRMPDRIWVSLDVWAALGSLVDVARLVMPPAQTEQPAGSASLADFRGDVIGLPRIVVPTFAAGTCIVGPSTLYEAYEEVVGLLSVVEPSILGVTVAYGGYVAWGTLQNTAFVPVTPP
jgi:HK97 family phage major capsid protein